MIFFNRHLKIGKEIGKATRKSIILPFVVYGKDQNFVPPPEFLTDMYIYGYITASISNLMDYAFGGKNCGHVVGHEELLMMIILHDNILSSTQISQYAG